MSLDNRLNLLQEIQSRIEVAQQELRHGGGDGSGGNGLENRLSRLESQYDKLRDDNTAIREQLARLNERVAHLPSKEFMVKAALGIVAGVGTLITFGERLQGLLS